MPLERNRLLEVECLEVPASVVLFKPAQRLRGGVNGRLAVALGLLQVGEVFALDSFVFRVVFAHGSSSLFQVTVYGGVMALAYLSLCLRKRDVQFPPILIQSRLAGAPVDHPLTVRADAFKVPQGLRNRQVVCHISSGPFRSMASNAIDFSRLAGPLIFRPARLEICGEIGAKNQHRTFSVTGWKPSLDPCAHGIFVDTEQAGDLFHRVAPMDFDQAVIRASLCLHGSPAPIRPQPCGPLAASPPDRESPSLTFLQSGQRSMPPPRARASPRRGHPGSPDE